MAASGLNEGVRVLDDFTTKAIPPTELTTPCAVTGLNEGIRMLDDFICEAIPPNEKLPPCPVAEESVPGSP